MVFTVLEDTPEKLVFKTSGVPLILVLLLPGIIILPAIIVVATTIAFTFIPAIAFVILVIMSVIASRMFVNDAVPSTWTLTCVNGKRIVHREKRALALCCMQPLSEEYELSNSLIASVQYDRTNGTTRVLLHLANGKYLPTTNGYSNMYHMQKQQLVHKLNSTFPSNQTVFVPTGQPTFVTPVTYQPPAQPTPYVPPQYGPPEPYVPPPTTYQPPQAPASYPPSMYTPPEVAQPAPYVLPPVVTTDPSARSVPDQLQTLSELHSQGVLSQEEYQQAQSRVLQDQPTQQAY